MTNLYGNTSHLFSSPYLTIAEYKSAPTAIDYNNLVVDSADPAAQDAELANMIARASSWIDSYCNQVLAATTETEQQRVRMSSDGYLKIHPSNWPVLGLTALSYGSQPNNLTAFTDLSQGWIEDQTIIMPWSSGSMNYSSSGPLSFGSPASARSQVYVKYSYINGYANTLLVSGTSGASSFVVKDATGILPGSHLTIYDGMNTETVTVASTYAPGSTTILIGGSLSASHGAGVAVSALPPAVKEAAILVTTAFLKVRGDYSMTMQVTEMVGKTGLNTASLNYDLELAKELLIPYRRIR